MKNVYLWVTLAVFCWLAGAPIANGQVIHNPFIKASPKKNPPAPRVQRVTQADSTLARLKIKQDLEQTLSDLYRLEHDLAERGRIWAESEAEWTDIRIVESNLNKAVTHFAASASHWEAEQYTDWLRCCNEAADVMGRSRPQVSRIEQMIRVRRGR